MGSGGPSCETTDIFHPRHMSYSLNFLKGGYIEDYLGEYHRGIKVDTRS